MKNNPIGVFDSGIGGINVLKKLVEKFPKENFIYVADTLNCPYGTKKATEIKDLISKVTKYLIDQKCKAIVIACNTATAQARDLFLLESPIILGVIYPTANEAIKGSKKLAILATNSTISSGLYQEVLLNANKEIYPVKCSLFVEPIENGEIGNDYSYKLVRDHLGYLKNENIDTVILGCTHFALYEKEINAVFPKARLVNSGTPISIELERILNNRGLLSDRERGKVCLKTTLSVELLKEQIKIFDLNYESIKKINV